MQFTYVYFKLPYNFFEINFFYSWKRILLNPCYIFGILLVLSINLASSSRGDKSYPFRMCVKECKRGCHLDEYPGKLPLYLTIFWWDCEDECKYQCMHKVTAANLQSNKAVQQFYGKVSSVWNFEIYDEALMVKVPCNSVAKWLSHQTENPRDPEFWSPSLTTV